MNQKAKRYPNGRPVEISAKAKRIRRIVNKQSGKIRQELIDAMVGQKFTFRWKVAWKIIRGKK